MIKLDIKPYCEHCPYFESRTCIQCEKQIICENIKNYLKTELDSEENN